MKTFKEYISEARKLSNKKVKELADWKADRQKRAIARMAELDAMPDPTPEEDAKNKKAVDDLIKNSHKYKGMMGS